MPVLADTFELGELFSRYARGVDTGDWALWDTAFTEDAHVDHRSAGAGSDVRTVRG